MFCVAFAIAAASFPLAVAFGTNDIWSIVQGEFAPHDYAFGPHSIIEHYPIYLHAFGSSSLHMIAGGLALAAAIMQFVPSVRRRWPVLHRATGALVVILVACSMVGSLAFQASHPLASTLSGAGFGLGLLSLCGLTLFELAMAVMAIRARDFRSHMGWMALMFASLLTAPGLRAQWLLFGHTGLHLDEANLVVAMSLVPQTILVMAFWMYSVGTRDLGMNPVRSLLPPAALHVLSKLSATAVLYAGYCVTFGIDVLHTGHSHVHPLGTIGLVWGLSTALLALRVPQAISDIGKGGHVSYATAICAIAAAVSGLLVARTLSGNGVQVIAQRSCFAAWNVEILLLLTLERCAARRRGVSWDMQWLYLILAPALWPFLMIMYSTVGVGVSIAITTAMAIAYATVAMLGFASTFGLRIRFKSGSPMPHSTARADVFDSSTGVFGPKRAQRPPVH